MYWPSVKTKGVAGGMLGGEGGVNGVYKYSRLVTCNVVVDKKNGSTLV